MDKNTVYAWMKANIDDTYAIDEAIMVTVDHFRLGVNVDTIPDWLWDMARTIIPGEDNLGEFMDGDE